MFKKYFLLVILFNLFIALAFYIENSDAAITQISGDLANIIPICKKLDNPSLYQKDLYLGDINDVKYYTPFYIESLRLIASITNYDYLKALNILSLITHFLYGIFWFYLLFLVKKDFWLAFGFSIFLRGILWPPGMELLGLSDLWTMMPRTLFSALIPLPFIIYKHTKDKLFLPAIVLGLLVNFHPISGIGAILIYFGLFVSFYFINNELFKLSTSKKIGVIIVGVFIGMLPYFITYLTNVKPNLDNNQNLFETAIHARISPIFFDGLLFLKSWNRPFTYFFGLIFISFFFIDSSRKKVSFKIILSSILLLLVFSNSIPFLEKQINNVFNLNLRVAFQLIRSQKLILVLLQIGMFLFLYEVSKKDNIQNRYKIIATIAYMFILSFSSASFFDKVPLVGDDISRFTLPNNLKIYSAQKKDDSSINEVFEFVNKNTTTTDLFYCTNVYFRAATNRSEVLDFHAAGMLIEGNPEKYIKAYTDMIFFNQCNIEQKITFLKNKKVNYIIDKQLWGNLNMVFKNNEYYIYKL
jgi:hypothetical protein